MCGVFCVIILFDLHSSVFLLSSSNPVIPNSFRCSLENLRSTTMNNSKSQIFISSLIVDDFITEEDDMSQEGDSSQQTPTPKDVERMFPPI